jgi:uncharacterized protein (TIGR00255 family)
MTGFGAASHAGGAGTLSVELRSVNSRHLKQNLRIPTGTERWEEPLREAVTRNIRRGHVDVTVRFEAPPEAAGSAGSGSSYRLDGDRVEAYLKALRTLKERHDLPGEIDMGLIGHCDRLMVEESPDPLESVAVETLVQVVERAAAQLVEMRQREGQRLATDIQGRLGALGRHLDAVQERAPARLLEERDRLRRSVAELADGVDVDEDRLAREIAILADRWDISEELVRARSHVEAFGELLAGPDVEPVGKRLGFLGQELLREINTIGSKANDTEISRYIVEAKNELESLREQIENVE